MRTREEEKQNVIEWLKHPSELGCAPKKIEYTNEFTDEDGIQCMIFKYKKTLFAPWLLAIASESGVFSEMQPYNRATEIEDAKKMVNFLKEYWKRKANELEEREERMKQAGQFCAFVLLKEKEWNPKAFEKQFEQEWGFTLEEGDSEKNSQELEEHTGFGVDARIYEVEGMRLILGYMDFAVPEEEAEYHAQFNYMWKDAVEITKTHSAHMIVTVMGDGAPQEKGVLYTKAITTLCRQENVVGVYANSVVYEPKFFVAMSELLENNQLPIFNLIWFGLGRSEDGTSGYTCGLNCFGKDEIEVINSKQTPAELRDFLINIADYVVSEDVILHDGETIGLTAEQRLRIVRSEGVNVEGWSLKIVE